MQSLIESINLLMIKNLNFNLFLAIKVITTLLLPFQILAYKEPLVSVIICSYNRGFYLERTVDSVLNSTYSNLEILIVDDGSSDPLTLRILENLEQSNSIIKVHRLNNNYGSGIFAKNYGFMNAKGDYMTIVDDDDTVYPESITQLVDYLESKKDIDVLVGFASIEKDS